MTGRWLSRDNVDEVMLYAYCANSPVWSFDILGNRTSTFEVNFKQSQSGFSIYCRVSITESECPKEVDVELSGGLEWQPPQLRAANLVLNLFRVHAEAGLRGLIGGKAKMSECKGKSNVKICARIEAFARIEYRDWKVHEMGRRNRFTRSRFGIGADGGGTACVDLETGDLTVSASVNWYAYANFGWSWFNRTYNYGGGWESSEKKLTTLDFFKIFKENNAKEQDSCCCIEKYGASK